ncbi:MAG: homoserine dehydrogenase [Ktedonobacteraceae bacterium]
MNMSPLPAAMPPLRLLLVGYGRVAQALLPLLASRQDWLASNLGVNPVISGIGTRSHGYYIHPLGMDTPLLAAQEKEKQLDWFKRGASRMDDVETFIQAGKDAGASVLVELTTLNPRDGQPALLHIRSALESGLDVVTANKGPIAFAQTELQTLARQHNVQLRFEATVIDGLPLINLAQFTLQGVGIHSFRAMLNATSSLVLDRIEQGFSQEEAIAQAQELGIAEADPWYDLDGWDAVMKTTILANNLLGGQLTPAMVKREGIRDLTPDAICAAAAAGTPIRLLSQAHCKDSVVVAEVRPHKIAGDDILNYGKGSTSVISLETEAMGTITLVEHEHEPAVLQTAYGVFSDLVTILQHRSSAPHFG